MKKLLAVDGNSILNRAFYGIRPLTNKEGLPTNAIYGMINILASQFDKIKPDYCAIAFDLREPTFRHKRFDGYKANRHGMPDDLAVQMDYAKQSAKALGFIVLEKAGYEADDILGTLADIAEKNLVEAYILTGDKDSLQLISTTTKILLATNSENVLFDTDKFKEKYGITPDCFVDVKALMGDSSDNIPGVAGVGEKTALKLISEFSSLDNLYANLDNAGLTAGLLSKLQNGKDNAYMSRELAEIYRQVPVGVTLEDLAYHGIDNNSAMRIFSYLNFDAFIKRFNITSTKPNQNETEACEKRDVSLKDLSVYKSDDVVAFDYDADKVSVFDGKCEYILSDISDIKRFFAECKAKLVCFDCKEIYKKLSGKGITYRSCYFDIMLAAYVLNSSARFEMEDIVSDYLGELMNEDVSKTQYVLLVYDIISKKIETENQGKLLFDIEMPAAASLADMELEGFLIDCHGIEQFGLKLDEMSGELTERIYYHAGEEFNINSPKQLGTVLFDKLQLPHGKKTKTGYSTNVDVLEKLSIYHPIIEDILEYRKVNKLKSTYVDGLLKVADEHNRVHTTFKQTGTATGRLSSIEPNLQNIPIRTELGRELRAFFVAKSGYVLIDADYSQIELRLLAHISGDDNMRNAFKEGIDIHTATASRVFEVSKENVTLELRKRAKAINFGILYGMGEYSLSVDLGISVTQAKKYIASYLSSYPAIETYLTAIKEQAHKDGMVTTLYGRRRYIPEINAKNKNLQAFGERVAMNSPIQGSAADIIKIAMININREFKARGLDAHMILQVHDELIVEANKSCAEEAKGILQKLMENAVKLDIPLSVGITVGEYWL